MNQRGYAQLCSLISKGRRAAPKGEYQLTRDDLVAGLDDCLALWLPEGGLDAAVADWLQTVFPRRCVARRNAAKRR